MSEFERLRSQSASAWRAGAWEMAESLALAALKYRPRDAEAQRLLALALHRQGRSKEACQRLRRALKTSSDNALLHMNLGTVLAAMGELDAAIASLRTACRLNAGSAAAWYNLGKTLKTNANDDLAREPLLRAIELDPGHAAAHAVLGDVYKALGDASAAERAFRQSLQLQPHAGHAWWGLANLKVVAMTAADIEALRQAIGSVAVGSEDDIRMRFALSRALEQQSCFDEAFQMLLQANALQRKRMPWDREQFSRLANATRQCFPSASAAEASAEGPADVVFIVSLPRAGSTLVEQVLAAHPQINAASELPDLPAVIAAESRRRGAEFPDWVGKMSTADWRRLGSDYRERTRRWRLPGMAFTDKLPSNFLYVGAALSMLPTARVIGVRRDRADTCWSCFQQYFASGQAFSYDLDDLVAYHSDYSQLNAYWQQTYPTRYLSIDYELLIHDLNATARRLLAHVGLPWDERCLRPDQARRIVRTASASQVREPVDQRGVGRSRPFAQALAPWLAEPKTSTDS